MLESNKNGKTWKVCIIEPGLSRNGIFYPSKVLQAAKTIFEKAKVCYYEWKGKHFDHLPGQIESMHPEGFPRQTAGYLDNIKYENVTVEGKTGEALTGVFHVFDSAKWLIDMLRESWQKGLKQFLGLSINADGTQANALINGRPVRVAGAINEVFSVDLVSHPAAGGKLLKMLESINPNKEESMLKETIALIKAKKPELLEGKDLANISDEEVKGIMKLWQEAEEVEKTEAEKKAEADKKAAEEKAKADKIAEADKIAADEKAEADKKAEEDSKVSEADKRIKELEDKLVKIAEANQINECKTVLNTLIESSGLPVTVKNKVAKRFAGVVFEEADLKEAIKDEKETLADLSKEEDIIKLDTDDGTFDIHIGRERTDKLQASLDLMIGYEPEDDEKDDYKDLEGFKGLKEAYIAFTGDTEITGQYAKSRLREATSGTFNYALGYTINRKMLKEYKAMPDAWKQIASTVPVKDFKMQELIRWGGFGVLPEVIAARTTQGTSTDTATPTYPELGFPVDTEQIYGIGTKGGMVTITRRAIINDDLRILQKIPTKLARAASNTLNQFVFDIMLNWTATGINTGTKWPTNAGVANSIALYVAAHNNYLTTAFGFDALNTLLTKMFNQGAQGYMTAITDSPLTDSATTVNVTGGTGQYIKAGDIVEAYGEYMAVDSVATDALTVRRGILGTTAIQHAATTKLYKITDRLGLQDITLFVPRALKGAADSINQSLLHPENAENGINTLKGFGKVVASQYLQGDVNNWYLSAGKGEIDLIEVGFLNGKETPEVLVQDQPTVGNVFTADTIRYKVRHEYGGALPDYRAFAAGIVA